MSVVQERVADPLLVEDVAPHPSPTTAAAALLSGFLLLMVGNGLQGTLIGIRSQNAGFSSLSTTLIMSAYFFGFLIGARLASKALGDVGHIRVFTALASMASTAALLHATFVEPVVWIAVRFISGVCLAGIYVVTESWLNAISTNATRGRLLAAYQIVTMGGMAVGQLLLSADDPNDYPLFIICSVLCSFALVPVALSTTSAPPILIPEAMPLREMAKLIPTGLVSALLIGGIQGTFMGLLAVYATRAGLTASEVSRLLFTPMVGAVVFQYPIGHLSDRVSRRGVMLADCAVVAVLATAMLQIDPSSLLAVGLMFFFGGAIFPLYSLSLAYMNDWVPTNKMVGASATFVVASGIGAATGPLAGGAIMSVFGNQFFWVALLGPTLTLASFLIWRIVFSDPVAVERKGLWVPVASRGSAVAAAVMAAPRRIAGRKPSGTGASVNTMETNQKHKGKTPPAS